MCSFSDVYLKVFLRTQCGLALKQTWPFVVTTRLHVTFYNTFCFLHVRFSVSIESPFLDNTKQPQQTRMYELEDQLKPVWGC